MKRAWSPAAEAKLRKLYPAGVPLSRIAFLLKRTEKAIKSRAMVLGVTRGSHRPWTQADDKSLAKLYASHSAAECAEKLGRTASSVQQRVTTLGLHKSPEWVAERARQRWAEGKHEGSRVGHFHKGQTPPNKGLRRPGWSPGRMAETQFKAGQRGNKWLPIGSERINADGYRDRKVQDTGYPPRDWVGVHKLLWIEHNGEVPKGHAVVFRNGNKGDIRIENLELVARGELMRRNTIHRYPPELRQVIRLNGRLKKLISEKTEETTS